MTDKVDTYVLCPSCRAKGKLNTKPNIPFQESFIKVNWQSTGLRALFGNLECGFRYKIPLCCNLFYSWFSFRRPQMRTALVVSKIYEDKNNINRFPPIKLTEDEAKYVYSKTGVWYEYE